MGELINISEIDRKKIIDDLSMFPKINPKFAQSVEKIYCFKKKDNNILIPFRYARIEYPAKFELLSVLDQPKTFTGSFRDIDQENAFREGLASFKKNNCLTIECRTGFGKTLFSAWVWDHTDSIAVVMITLTSLIDSWKNTFVKHFNILEDEIVVVGDKKSLKSACDTPRIFICMAERLDKLELPSGKVTLIVDEAHFWCTQRKLSQLLSVKTDYFIACSATLKKGDGTDKLMRHFSGEVSVYRPANIAHYFVEYLTGLKFETPMKSHDEVDFAKLMSNVGKSSERNDMILSIISAVAAYKRKIMVLGRLTDHVEYLYNSFKECNAEMRVELVYKDVKKFKDCDVLFGTLSKLSTGFDYASALNGECDGVISVVLFINTISQETTYEQAKGRGMRGENPLIIMLKDDNFLLNKHINKNRTYRKSTNSTEIQVKDINELKNVLENPIIDDF